jgi:hypothetical protein
MPRDVTDAEGTTWNCIQAFAGLGNDPDKKDAAQVEGSDRIRVVCTPSGGAKSVRLELPGDWEKAMADEDLADAIRTGLRRDRPA